MLIGSFVELQQRVVKLASELRMRHDKIFQRDPDGHTAKIFTSAAVFGESAERRRAMSRTTERVPVFYRVSFARVDSWFSCCIRPWLVCAGDGPLLGGNTTPRSTACDTASAGG
jgi:hypothetical protein